MIVDTCRIDSVRDAPGGGILVDARIGRSGVQLYRRADGTTVRAYRPSGEVRAADFAGAPLTVGHPAGGVSPDNYSATSVGVARSAIGEDIVDGDVHPKYALQVSDAAAIAGVRSKALCELSCGYTAIMDWTAGVTDAGAKYDVVFSGIHANHIALGGPGFARAGRGARVLLDSEDSLMADTMYVADEADKPTSGDGAIALLLAEVDSSRRERDKLIADSEGLRAELDAALGKLAAAEATIAAHADADIVAAAAAVEAEIKYRSAASEVLADGYDFAGRSHADVDADVRAARISRIKQLTPDATVEDSASDAWVESYLAGAEAFAKKALPAKHDYAPKKGAIQDVADGDEDMASFIRRRSAERYGGKE